MAHDFMLETLAHVSLPRGFREFVSNLYMGNGCKLSAGGSTRAGFAIRAVVRQGCPLPPLLFAFCGDMLPRRLTAGLPDDLVRAYSDDVGLVTRGLLSAAGTFVSLFRRFASISGLGPTLRKAVVVPLGEAVLGKVRTQLVARFLDWGAAPVRRWAEYLGFVVGPTGADRTWRKALAKFDQRISFWAQLGLGLHSPSVAYNTYVVSVLTFIGQLASLPPTWASVEATGLALGPRPWVLGLPRRPPRPRAAAWHAPELHGPLGGLGCSPLPGRALRSRFRGGAPGGRKRQAT